MASFENVPEACSCAKEMQQELMKENQILPPEDRVAIRIALHYGKAVIEKDDVFGDAVNVASRVEKYTDGDQILISQAVYDQIQGNPEITTRNVGSVTMKGKSEKMPLYRLLWYDEEIVATLPDLDSDIVEQEATTPLPKSGAVTLTSAYKMILLEKSKSDALDQSLKNPYMNRVMIQDIDEFYGRDIDVEKIYSRIGSSRPQSISIVGERRIGKSSLLNYIYHPANRLKYLKRPDEYIFIFIDFQERRNIEIPDFFSILYEGLYEEFHGNIELSVDPDYEGFKKIISTFDEHGLKLIMLFDEFELITKNTNFNSEFYSFCRSIANNFNVSYIVSSGRNLQTLCHSKVISDSPFFNIFSNLTVSQYNRTDAVSLIKGPAEKMNYKLQSYVDFIIDIAGFYPFFIQIACASLFEYVKDGKLDSKAMIEAVKEDFLDEAKVHFQQIWETANVDEREVLLTLAVGKKIQHSQEYLVKILEKEGYVKPGKKKPEIFSSLFGEYILNRYGSSSKSRSFIWPFSGSTKRSAG
jgi:AAA+ ATPase superfamily predicted ATPase